MSSPHIFCPRDRKFKRGEENTEQLPCYPFSYQFNHLSLFALGYNMNYKKGQTSSSTFLIQTSIEIFFRHVIFPIFSCQSNKENHLLRTMLFLGEGKFIFYLQLSLSISEPNIV